MQRTHLARHDLDWLPSSLKAVRWTVAGSIWTGIAGLVLGVGLLPGKGFHFYFFGKSLAVLIGGGYYAGDKAARAVLRRRLSKLAHGDVDLQRLRNEADGELLHVRGRVVAKEKIPMLIDDTEQVVYRRVLFELDGTRVIHEAASDFWVVDDSGERALVEVEGARVVVADPKKYDCLESVENRLLALPMPQEMEKLVLARRQRQLKNKKVPVLQAGEWALRDGDQVEIVGFKSRTVDPTVAMRLERDTPMRATLRAGRELPLIISVG